MHQPIYHFLSSSFLLFFQTSIWDHFPSIWMYTFEVPLVEVCSLHTLSFYLFECLYFTLVLRKIFTEWTLLGWYCFLSAHWSYYSTYFWLSMLMLKSQSLIYVSFLFSLAAFFDFCPHLWYSAISLWCTPVQISCVLSGFHWDSWICELVSFLSSRKLSANVNLTNIASE